MASVRFGLFAIILSILAISAARAFAEPMPPVDYRVYAPFSLLDPQLQQAWDAALKNDFAAARQEVEACLSSKPDDVLALDLASILAWEAGDPEVAQKLWMKALDAAPSSPLTEVFIRRLEFFRGLCPRDPKIEIALERYLKNSQGTPAGRALAADFLLQLKQERLDEDGAAKLISQSGILTQWQSVAGPFAYTGGSSDLDRPFGPEWDAEATSYTLAHRVIAWHAIPAAPLSTALDVGSLVYPPSGVAYLKAAVDAPEETRWTLRIVTASGYKIYLNGECVARHNPPADVPSAEQVWLLPLKAGRNTLLLKTRHVTSPWRIALQSLDPAVRWVSDSAKFPPATIWDPPISDGSEGLESFYPSAQAAAEYRIFLLHEIDRRRAEGNYALARRALERLEKAFPDSALVGNRHGSLALQQSADQSWSEIRLRNEARGAYESVLARQSDNFRALQGLTQVNLEQRQVDRGRELADRMANLKPGHPWALLLQARVAFEKEWEKELLDSLKNPSVQNLANPMPALMLAQHSARNHVPAAGAEALKELADNGFATDEVLEQGSNFSVQADDLEGATKFLAPLLERHPNDYRSLVYLGDLYTKLDHDSLARTTYEYALSVNPDAPDAFQSLGNLWALQSENGLALQAYSQALLRNPADGALRDKLRRFGGKETFYAPYDSPPTLDDASTYTAERYPKADTAWIRDVMVEEFHADESSDIFTRTSVKLLNKQGRAQWDEIGFSTDRGDLVEARAILPDGKIFEPESLRVEGRKGAASMFGLVDGAVVDTADTRAVGSGQRPEWNGRKTTFTFQHLAAPLALARLVLLVPDGFSLRYERTPPDFSPVETKLADGRRVLVWEKRNLPGLEQERFQPPDTELAPHVTYTTVGGWAQDFARRWETLQFEIEDDPALRAKAEELIGRGGLNRRALERLYLFVNEEIKSGSHRGTALDTFYLRSGSSSDQLYLAASLLRATGQDYRVGFLGGGLPKTRDDALPETGEFGTPVLYLPSVEGAPFVMQFPSRYAPLRNLLDSTEVQPVLWFESGHPILEPLNARAAEAGWSDTLTRVRLRSDGSALVAGKVSFGGRMGVSLRDANSDPARRNMLRDQIVISLFPNLQELKSEVVDADSLSAPFVVSFSGRRDHAAEPESGGLRWRPFEHKIDLSRFIVKETRETPLRLSGTVLQARDEVLLEIPPDLRLAGVADDYIAIGPWGTFSICYVPVNEGVRVIRSVWLKDISVGPDDYPSFVRFCREADERDIRAILLAPRTGAQPVAGAAR